MQQDGRGIAQARHPVDAELGRRLRSCARTLGVSAATLCHVAWALVVGRLSTRTDVVFGTVLFGRMQSGAGSDRVMGPFINTLPVRLQLDAESVAATVRRTQLQLADLLRHEHASLALTQRCSAVPAPAPLFTSLLNYRHGTLARGEAAGRAWAGIRVAHSEQRTNYPVVLSVDDWGDAGFGLTVHVVDTLSAERVWLYMHTALEAVIAALETSPATPLATLDVLPGPERHDVLERWNDTATTFPDDQCIHQLFEAQVTATPDAVALVCGEAAISYATLHARTNQLAHHLRTLGRWS